MHEKKITKFFKIGVLCLGIIGLLIIIGISSYYINHYYDSTTCTIWRVTKPEPFDNQDPKDWFIEIDYTGLGCGNNKTYNITNDTLELITDDYEYYSNINTFECYYYKHSNPCSVYFTKPWHGGFAIALALSLGIVIFLIGFTIAEIYKQVT
jgi:hypothetical protein